MKSILGIIVLLLVNLSVFGNMTSIVEPELKVMAKSGLKLRLAPNLESPVIDVINYGASLERLNDFVSTATPVKNQLGRRSVDKSQIQWAGRFCL